MRVMKAPVKFCSMGKSAPVLNVSVTAHVITTDRTVKTIELSYDAFHAPTEHAVKQKITTMLGKDIIGIDHLTYTYYRKS